VVFLFVLIELFFIMCHGLGATREYRWEIGVVEWVSQFRPKFQVHLHVRSAFVFNKHCKLSAEMQLVAEKQIVVTVEALCQNL